MIGALEQHEDQEQRPVAVERLMQALTKAVRATQLYLPNNPVYVRAIDNIRDAFEPVWDECPELHLTVSETELGWEGHVVLSHPSKSESLAWVLYKDGVRSLTMQPGVEDEEIIRFLRVVHEASNLPADAPDDLLTLLWDQDFQLIRYETVEVALDDALPLTTAPPEPAPEPQDVRRTVQDEAKEEKRPVGIVDLEEFDSTLYFLDEQEIEYLKGEIEREYKSDLRHNVFSMLFDLLELQTYSTVRAELITILENFIPYLLAVGDFHSVAYILQDIRAVLERARELLPEHRKTLQRFPDMLSEEDALGQLLQSLDEALVHPSEEELSALFRELRPKALQTILRWLPRLTNERVQALLEVAARRLAQENVHQVTEALKTDDEAGLVRTIQMVGQLKLSAVIPVLGKLLADGNLPVKRAVVEALGAMALPGAMRQLERALNDSERDVRVSAVRAMASQGHRGAFPAVEAAVTGKALRDADLTEKTAFFEAYGLLAGSSGLAKLQPMLIGRGFLRRKHHPQTRACAALAMGKIGTPEAREVLLGVAGDKDPLVRNAVNQALREIG